MCPVATGCSASAIDVIWDRAAEWERRLAMIADARQFLYQSLFYLEYDAYGRAMLDALTAAQRRGVRVQLIIDSFGQRLGGVLMSYAVRRELADAVARLRHSGGVVTFYTPPRWMQRWFGGGHHYKVQISDAGEALLCSGNVTKSSFEGWNECALALRGPLVPALLEHCRAIGGDVAQADVDHLRTLAPAHGTVPLDVWFCNPNDHQGPLGVFGRQGRNTVTDQMVAMADAAQRTLAITSFYFKPAPVLMDAVLKAARRGVQVEVFHSHLDALPATDLAWIASAAGYGTLLDAGVHIRENRHGEHSKIVLVDDDWVAYGSYNFEDAAHERLAEAMVATRDQSAVAAARAILEGLRHDPDNVTVTRDSIAALPPRVQRRVWMFGRFKRWI